LTETVTPYQAKDKSKKSQVADMFNNIASDYDFLNHFLSAGIDILWRKKAIRLLKKHKPETILDVATGTADFAIEALKLNPIKVTGIDISEKMLEMGRIKIEQKKLTNKIELHCADSENIPFNDSSFDAVTVAFGVRNFENLDKGLNEMHRILKKGGVAVVLEFSKPDYFPVKQLYGLYFNHILPVIGKIVSKDNRAYEYLPESVNAFPYGKKFCEKMKTAGFTDCMQHKLTFGIASIYIAKK
jgi:demethylmenaquinone methyltransferase / 2-methoxy-6-polyprenyl-1,4-benzoquinol methylase